jgi:hypothetical protein
LYIVGLCAGRRVGSCVGGVVVVDDTKKNGSLGMLVAMMVLDVSVLLAT